VKKALGWQKKTKKKKNSLKLISEKPDNMNTHYRKEDMINLIKFNISDKRKICFFFYPEIILQEINEIIWFSRDEV